jgi:glycosyltransferase involved in cell wall biosynthesis
MLHSCCVTLEEEGVQASAVVVTDDQTLLSVANDLGFGTVEQDNAPLGRKWNDGYQLACDPEYNPHPADYVIPLGSDDWIDPEAILRADFPLSGEIVCFRKAGFVSEDGSELAYVSVPYNGGLGIRIIPASLLSLVDYRPVKEERMRACDASCVKSLVDAGWKQRFVYSDQHALQIVDWKTNGEQLNPYKSCRHYAVSVSKTPWDDLTEVYGADPVEAMRKLYV